MIVSQQTHSFSSEQQLNTPAQQKFWQQVTQGRLKTATNIELAYAFIKHPNSEQAIVLSSGRLEAYLKYQELMFDLYQQGYSIYIVDHRGQGLSSRSTSNPHKGHIDDFNDYIVDFSLFIDLIVKPKQFKHCFLVGHSMGGAIATLYLQANPHLFTAAAFSAPMYGIKLPINRSFIRWLAALLAKLSSRGEPNYILAGQDYHADPFNKNNLTHSQARYRNYRAIYQDNPQIQLGSPTNHWLLQAIDAAEQARLAAKTSPIPLLILQAEKDTIVDNEAQNNAVASKCKLLTIPNARHEIFMERDTPRDMALNTIVDFFNAIKKSYHTST